MPKLSHHFGGKTTPIAAQATTGLRARSCSAVIHKPLPLNLGQFKFDSRKKTKKKKDSGQVLQILASSQRAVVKSSKHAYTSIVQVATAPGATPAQITAAGSSVAGVHAQMCTSVNAQCATALAFAPPPLTKQLITKSQEFNQNVLAVVKVLMSNPSPLQSLIQKLVHESQEMEKCLHHPHQLRLQEGYSLLHVSNINIKGPLLANSKTGQMRIQKPFGLWASSFVSALLHTCWRKGGALFYIYEVDPSCDEYELFDEVATTGNSKTCAVLRTTGPGSQPVSPRAKYCLDLNAHTMVEC
jgi:hypothetical protein